MGCVHRSPSAKLFAWCSDENWSIIESFRLSFHSSISELTIGQFVCVCVSVVLSPWMALQQMYWIYCESFFGVFNFETPPIDWHIIRTNQRFEMNNTKKKSEKITLKYIVFWRMGEDKQIDECLLFAARVHFTKHKSAWLRLSSYAQAAIFPFQFYICSLFIITFGCERIANVCMTSTDWLASSFAWNFFYPSWRRWKIAPNQRILLAIVWYYAPHTYIDEWEASYFCLLLFIFKAKWCATPEKQANNERLQFAW